MRKKEIDAVNYHVEAGLDINVEIGKFDDLLELLQQASLIDFTEKTSFLFIMSK